ncbi:hypothetical protein FA048_15740 [Pedobacter polaris]|uniref:DUF4843 domain-containing protein n=1 Tax=Pedobacter polaris TaxID=2571273 RepID=A0A4U1CH78_9SPHI|nr:hypothetical protein [Pedobacter polaris]TKC06655.1 hypothetical protein FA048_15740 [Pedobacter polaris]
MKINKIYLGCLSMMLLALASCKKGDQNFFYKGDLLPITLTGFNGSSEELNVKVDTFKFAVPLQPNSSFVQSNSYEFRGTEDRVKLLVSEKKTGKVVMERELKKEDGPVKINFLYMDGKAIAMPAKPAIEDGKISLIYMFQPTVTKYTEPVDFVVGKYYVTPQVFEEIVRAKNVKPNEFSTPVTLPTFSVARQDYNGVMTSVSFVVRICKAGTNTLYTDGTTYTWNALSSTAPKPAASVASSKLYIFSELPSGNSMRFATRLEQ